MCSKSWLFHLVVCVTTLISPGCADGVGPSEQNPQQPKSSPPPYVAGNYALTLVDGQALPFVLDTLKDCAGEGGAGPGTEWISSGSIDFNLDSTYAFRHVVSYVCWPSKGWKLSQGDGTYSVRSDRTIALSTTSGNKPGSVRYTNSGDVQLVWHSHMQIYEKEAALVSRLRSITAPHQRRPQPQPTRLVGSSRSAVASRD